MYHLFVENDCYYFVNEMVAKEVLDDVRDREDCEVDVQEVSEDTRYVMECERCGLYTFSTYHEAIKYQRTSRILSADAIEEVGSWVDRKCEEYNIARRIVH